MIYIVETDSICGLSFPLMRPLSFMRDICEVYFVPAVVCGYQSEAQMKNFKIVSLLMKHGAIHVASTFFLEENVKLGDVEAFQLVQAYPIISYDVKKL